MNLCSLFHSCWDPLTFHCDYAEVVLEELGETSFSESYMSGLTEMIIDSLMTIDKR